MDSHHILQRVVEEKRLDRWAKPLQARLSGLFEPDSAESSRIADFLRGRWLGQPLHTALVHVPVGTWTMAAFLDLFSANPSVRPAAAAAILVGLLFSIPAMITGLVDWFPHTSESVRRIGFLHMAANGAAVLFYALSYGLRWGDHVATAVLIGYLGFGSLMISGFLGRAMVYRLRVGVNGASLREVQEEPEGFVTVARLEDLEYKKPLRVQVGEQFAVLVRTEERVYALADRSSYDGSSLGNGRVIGECLVSSDHQTAYRLEDGYVVRGPGIYPQPVFEVYVRGQEVRVSPDPLPSVAESPIVRQVSML